MRGLGLAQSRVLCRHYRLQRLRLERRVERRPRAAFFTGFFAADLRAVFLATVFRVAVFLEAVLRTGFLAAFLTGPLRAVLFFVTDFFAAALRVGFLAAAFRAGALRTAFLAAAFFAGLLRAADCVGAAAGSCTAGATGAG